MSVQDKTVINTKKLPPIKPPGPPKIWEVIDEVNKDGKSMKFTIQEISEDRYEDAIQHMCTYFLADEPICKSLHAIDEPAFVEDCSVIWRQIFKQGISIAAFADNPNGGKPIIAGMNALGVDFEKHKSSIDDFNFTSQNARTVFAVIMGLSHQCEVFERYEVDKYMFAFGLSVAPAYRGHGLGLRILKIREKIGREYGIPVTSTAFTSHISQKSAVRAGFEVLLEKDYDDIVDENGKQYFPDVQTKTLKVMARRIS